MGNFRYVRKVISVFVICCFIVGVLLSTNSNAGVSEAHMFISEEKALEISMRQAPVIDMFERICDLFNISHYEKKFPDWYGGAYLADDNRLIIKYLSGHDYIIEQINDIFSSGDIIFKETDVSCQQFYSSI